MLFPVVLTPLTPFRQAKQTCSACKDEKFQSDHAEMLPSRLNCMISPVDLGNLCAERHVMNTPSQPEY